MAEIKWREVVQFLQEGPEQVSTSPQNVTPIGPVIQKFDTEHSEWMASVQAQMNKLMNKQEAELRKLLVGKTFTYKDSEDKKMYSGVVEAVNAQEGSYEDQWDISYYVKFPSKISPSVEKNGWMMINYYGNNAGFSK